MDFPSWDICPLLNDTWLVLRFADGVINGEILCHFMPQDDTCSHCNIHRVMRWVVWFSPIKFTFHLLSICCSYCISYPAFRCLLMGRGECRLCLLRIHRNTPQGFGGFILMCVYFKTPVLLSHAIDWGLSQFIIGIPTNQLVERGNRCFCLSPRASTWSEHALF